MCHAERVCYLCSTWTSQNPLPPPRGRWAVSGHICDCHDWVLLALSGWGQGCCPAPHSAQGGPFPYTHRFTSPKCLWYQLISVPALTCCIFWECDGGASQGL